MTLQIKSLQEYQEAYKYSVEAPEAFWAEQASTFSGAENGIPCLRMTLSIRMCSGSLVESSTSPKIAWTGTLATRGDQTAILWEANDPNKANISYTYRQLLAAVNKCANALKEMGVGRETVCFTCP